METRLNRNKDHNRTEHAPGLPAQARIEQALDSAPEVSALPQVVAKVIDLATDLSATAAEIERVISVDPGFCARLLKLANSAYFGLPRKVSSIREAVVLLGGRTIRNLALTVSCYNVFIGKTDADSLLRRELWRHSVLCATCTRSLASFGSGCPKGEGFVAGLLHDIGKSIALTSMRSEALAAVELQRREQITSPEAEVRAMGFDHTQIGARLATKWNLPDILVHAIEHHHSAGALEPSPARALAASVALADSIVHMLGSDAQYGSEGVPEDVSDSNVDVEAAEVLGIAREDLSRIVMMLVSEVANAPTLQSLAA